MEDGLRTPQTLVRGRNLGTDTPAVQADADAEGRIDWSMVGVDSTSCRAHQHAAGARRKAPRVPKKDQRPGSTAPTRDSDGPGAD